MRKFFTLPASSCKLMLIVYCLSLLPSYMKAQDDLLGLTSNGGTEGRGTMFTIKTTGASFSIIKSFADWGKTPWGDLIQGTDGNFYGMTSLGGTYNCGTVFKVTSIGVVTVLHQLNYATDGANPYGELMKGADGNFYGLTSSGGTNSYGTIFKMTPAGIFTVIRHLSHADGTNPRGHLVLGADGNYYGATYSGGSNSYGTIFKLTTTGTFTVLRNLNSAADGANCYGSLVKGSDNNFYGITNGGGTSGQGTIFKITPGGVYTVLRQLNAVTDGGHSQSDLIQATDGNFYGMAYSGGTSFQGTVFKITSTGTFTTIRSFVPANGTNPLGSLVQGADGNFYGLTSGGGASAGGTIFKITPAGTLTVLRSLLSATDGGNPKGSLAKATDGSFYGLTNIGGSNLFGTLFKITSAGAFTVLTRFNGATQGNAPFETVLKAKDSSYYGTASSGGLYNYGTIFKICRGTVTMLRSFNRNTDGGTPKGSLVQGTDGYLYGCTTEGGTGSAGTIFKISPTGVFAVLKNLSATADGGSPQGSLLAPGDGNFYGMTKSGGANGSGTIFKLTPTGAYTVLRHLAGSTDGANPEGNLVRGSDGNFYGVTYTNGRIFRITPGGVFTVLHAFLASTEGSYPAGSLVLGTDGKFYGTTSGGGINNAGTIFKVTPTGTITILKVLSPATDGGSPRGNLVMGTDGNFYGATSTGGSNKAGTVFKITPAGVYTVLRQLNMAVDGGNSYGSLIISQVNKLLAIAQSIATNKNMSRAITLAGTGSSALVYTVITQPQHGTVTTGSGAGRTYTPALNYSGSDLFTFTVSVGCLTSPPATVSIIVNPGINATLADEITRDREAAPFSKAVLYPNPATNMLSITLDGFSGRVSATISDEKGVSVRIINLTANGNRRMDVDVSSLKQGIYFLKLQSGRGSQTLKFTKL